MVGRKNEKERVQLVHACLPANVASKNS